MGKKYGNPNYGGMKGLISNSRKRRFWQIQQKRELQELGIKRNEISDLGIQNMRRVETSSSESENELGDALKPFRPKLRMKMYADEEEDKQKQKRLRLLRYSRKDDQNVGRRRLIQSMMIGSTQPEDSDDSLDDQDDIVADRLRRGGFSVWERLTNLNENDISEFEEASDLRNKLQSRGSSVEEWTRSVAPITGDLRSKLDRIRNKQYVHKHCSPLLIRVANDQTD